MVILVMRPSRVQYSWVSIYDPPPINEQEEERLARLYPPEVVHERYWKGGFVKAHPDIIHTVDATPSQNIVPQDWTIRALYPLLSNHFKSTVVMLLMARNRPECPLSIFPVEVLLYLLEFAIPVKVFCPPEHDLFYWLGTAKGTANYSVLKTMVKCIASSIASGSPSVLIEKQGGSGYTNPIPNSWVNVDLSPSNLKLCCTHYSYSTRKYGGTPRALRNWEFQASNDGINWVILRKHVEDTSIPDINGASATFAVDSKCYFYSQFRIVQTGPNAYRETGTNHWQDNYAQLNFGNLELWGCILE